MPQNDIYARRVPVLTFFPRSAAYQLSQGHSVGMQGVSPDMLAAARISSASPVACEWEQGIYGKKGAEMNYHPPSSDISSPDSEAGLEKGHGWKQRTRLHQIRDSKEAAPWPKSMKSINELAKMPAMLQEKRHQRGAATPCRSRVRHLPLVGQQRLLVPGLIRWPAQIPAPTQSCEAAGTPVPP